MSVSFAGGVVTDGGGLPEFADATVSPAGLRLVGKTGQAAELPMHDLEVTSGGFEGDMVSVYSPSVQLTFQTNAPGFLDALAEVGGPKVAQDAVQATQDIGKRQRARKVWMGITAVIVLAVLIFLWRLPSMVASAASKLPVSVDESIGEVAYSGATEDFGSPVHVPEVDAFLSEVVARLSPVAAPGPDGERFEFQVEVYESEVTNAFALPGGRIVVLTGLLEQAESGEQVAGVLAHEMAHVTQRHGLRNAAYSASTRIALLLLVGDDGWGELAGGIAGSARENAYSREQETNADLEGARMLAEAGLDPNDLSGFFEQLQERGEGMPSALTWLSTHPDHESRIAAIAETRAELTVNPRPLRSDWAAVQAALTRPAPADAK